MGFFIIANFNSVHNPIASIAIASVEQSEAPSPILQPPIKKKKATVTGEPEVMVTGNPRDGSDDLYSASGGPYSGYTSGLHGRRESDVPEVTA